MLKAYNISNYFILLHAFETPRMLSKIDDIRPQNKR